MLNPLIELRNQYNIGKIDKLEYSSKCLDYFFYLKNYSEFLKESGISSIDIKENKLIVTTKFMSIKFKIDSIDKGIVPISRFMFDESEEKVLTLLKKLISKNYPSTFTMLDIGANIGWFSMNFAKFFPKSSIYAFEPIPKTYKNLRENITLNSLENVFTRNIGLSDSHSTQTFYCDETLCGNASLVNHTNQPNIQKSNILVYPLDKLPLSPNFIKIDVEGAEFLVLKGAKQTLINYHPILYIEMLRKWSARFNYHPNDIIHFLSSLGYSCFTSTLTPFETMTDSTEETNFIFLHTSHRMI